MPCLGLRDVHSMAQMIEENVETKVPLLELPRTTTRRLKESRG